MEKEMLALVNLKEGKLETFMGWMQSDEGLSLIHISEPTRPY